MPTQLPLQVSFSEIPSDQPFLDAAPSILSVATSNILLSERGKYNTPNLCEYVEPEEEKRPGNDVKYLREDDENAGFTQYLNNSLTSGGSRQ